MMSAHFFQSFSPTEWYGLQESQVKRGRFELDRRMILGVRGSSGNKGELQAIRRATLRPAVGGGSGLPFFLSVSVHSSTISQSCAYSLASLSPWQHGPTTRGH